MVSQISFTGTYKVDNQNLDSFSKFQSYASRKEIQEGVRTIFEDKIVKGNEFGSFNYRAEQTLIVPDYMNIDVETFCANNGISYKKYETQDLLNPKTIKYRIAQAPKGYRKVEVDAEKLEKLARNQNTNLDHCRSDYYKNYSESVDTMLRSGDEISTTTLSIYDPSGNEDLKRYVDTFGVERLNEEQIFVTFNQTTNKPDHCAFFAFEDMGMSKIPVYVDSKTYEAGTILGLFK